MGMFHTDHYALVDGQLRTPPRRPSRDQIPSGWVAKDLFLNNFIVTSSVMVRRTEFERVKGFSTTIRVTGDFELWLRLSRVCPIGYVGAPLVTYRDHEQSLSSELRWHFGFAEMICTFVRTHPEIHRELGRATVHRQIRDIYWRGGYAHFLQEHYADAARLFASAWSWTPHDLRPLLYAAACLAGRQGVSLAREAKEMLGLMRRSVSTS
jgi:hypothetical protein